MAPSTTTADAGARKSAAATATVETKGNGRTRKAKNTGGGTNPSPNSSAATQVVPTSTGTARAPPSNSPPASRSSSGMAGPASSVDAATQCNNRDATAGAASAAVFTRKRPLLLFVVHGMGKQSWLPRNCAALRRNIDALLADAALAEANARDVAAAAAAAAALAPPATHTNPKSGQGSPTSRAQSPFARGPPNASGDAPQRVDGEQPPPSHSGSGSASQSGADAAVPPPEGWEGLDSARWLANVASVDLVPIEYHSVLHGLPSTDARVADIRLSSVPALRDIINDFLCDPLYYFSNFHGRIVRAEIVKQLNSKYREYVAARPGWNGQVAIIAHSMGGLVMWDLLNEVQATRDALDRCPEHDEADTSNGSAAGTAWQPPPALEFPLAHVFTMGSPISNSLVLRGHDARRHYSPAARFHSLYHPLDPIAYRLEPIFHRAYARIPPVLVPVYASPPARSPGTPLHRRLLGSLAAISPLPLPALPPLPPLPDMTNSLYYVRERVSERVRSLMASVWADVGAASSTGDQSDAPTEPQQTESPAELLGDDDRASVDNEHAAGEKRENGLGGVGVSSRKRNNGLHKSDQSSLGGDGGGVVDGGTVEDDGYLSDSEGEYGDVEEEDDRSCAISLAGKQDGASSNGSDVVTKSREKGRAKSESATPGHPRERTRSFSEWWGLSSFASAVLAASPLRGSPAQSPRASEASSVSPVSGEVGEGPSDGWQQHDDRKSSNEAGPPHRKLRKVHVGAVDEGRVDTPSRKTAKSPAPQSEKGGLPTTQSASKSSLQPKVAKASAQSSRKRPHSQVMPDEDEEQSEQDSAECRHRLQPPPLRREPTEGDEMVDRVASIFAPAAAAAAVSPAHGAKTGARVLSVATAAAAAVANVAGSATSPGAGVDASLPMDDNGEEDVPVEEILAEIPSECRLAHRMDLLLQVAPVRARVARAINRGSAPSALRKASGVDGTGDAISGTQATAVGPATAATAAAGATAASARRTSTTSSFVVMPEVAATANEYLGGLKAHFEYWASKDLMAYILRTLDGDLARVIARDETALAQCHTPPPADIQIVALDPVEASTAHSGPVILD